MATASTLYAYVSFVGAVELQRATLPQFARDLEIPKRDLVSLIERMVALGCVSGSGEFLRFAAPEVAR